MNRLVNLLREDHDALWRLLDDVTDDTDTTDATGGPARDPVPRRPARRLVALLSAHELAEERVVWPAVRRLCEDGDALARTALAQEDEAKRALRALARLPSGGPGFTACLRTLAGLTRAHLTYEQEQVWPRLESRLTERDDATLARRWRAARRRAPTRPHPWLPARPAVLGTVGPAVAALDRARDALRARTAAGRT
ncbi:MULTISPECIES: hemerythrin domain-containing protein [Streptomyces]|jgi:hemerythrin superfamily protein|uniref:Hemerythrin HHE cation binding domain-containing protein n=2 Tax=Streptomyces griseoaurantiacus TaxID=68213 RepID=A0A1G7Y4R5_9ACTN|nr:MULTISPECIES: hemerythrin domain-containing protein [Streptomyces]MBA5223752.1 hemerythrin domain-containing protein [Streptomyces griseoaurantiacus]MDX3092474.1 hemerythrin domain-containing protein [Streptomyces sp. ME12-02E]MDX3335894.1 hemerythrin domain-containing protein [Streptomyces sp. ME02-6978a]MDX3363935.1 hemerythrin domain-containing protein [Streptomyces sp. ME02-6978.2a]SDG91256.1 Hemerythrin HHE cation binding domain-containing protein [Streptomyces jietaisiensis]